MVLNSATLKDSVSSLRASSYDEALDPRMTPIHLEETLPDDSTEISLGRGMPSMVETTAEKDPRLRIVGVVPGRAKPYIKTRFKLLQKWEGTVIEVEDEVIRAQIQDLFDRSQPLEEVTFSIEEVSKSDRSLIAPGAVFYWMIGYLDRVTGQRTRESRIVFRRLPEWRQSEIAVIERQSRPLVDLLPEKEAEALRERIGSL